MKFPQEIPDVIEGEIWEDAPGYAGRYAVSNFGRIFAFSKTWLSGPRLGAKYVSKSMFMKPSVSDRGYLYISLSDGLKRKTFRVNRLIALAFLPNPTGLPEVNHIDGNKKNNRHDNLEWATHQRNMEHAGDTGLCEYGQNHRRAIITNEQAIQAKQLLKTMSRSAVAATIGTSYSCIRAIDIGQTWRLIN